MNKEEKLKQRIGYLVGQYENAIADLEIRIDDLTQKLAEANRKSLELESALTELKASNVQEGSSDPS